MEKALAKKEPFSTYNRDIFHAFEITLAAFRHAQKEVLLLSHKLDVSLYDVVSIKEEIESS